VVLGRVAVAVAVAGLLTGSAACGEGDQDGSAAPLTPSAPSASSTLPSIAGSDAPGPPPALASRLPDVQVDDLAGGKVALTSLSPSELPVLVWFWAPH